MLSIILSTDTEMYLWKLPHFIDADVVTFPEVTWAATVMDPLRAVSTNEWNLFRGTKLIYFEM